MRKITKLSMKALAGFLLVVILFGFSCNEPDIPNGWYNLNDKGTKITGEAIVTVKDFKEIDLVSSPYGDSELYEIVGLLKDDKKEVFADATRNAIGKHIGFVYNGMILTAPVVNLSIQTGNFSIINDSFTDKDIALGVYNDLKKEMDY